MNPPIADWANFFVAEVSASAALAGLVVVAISINLSRILSIAQLPGRAGEALVTLVGALVLTSAGLVPNQSPALFGGEIFAIGLLTLLMPLIIQLRSMKFAEGISSAKRWARSLMSLAASLPFVLGGTLLVLGSASGLYWAAAGVVISLVAGVYSTWVLLVEILR